MLDAANQPTEGDPKMSDTKNPFGDFETIFKQMKIPGLDMDAMMAAYRKNVEAVTSATRVANEGMLALVKRQAEIVKDALEQVRVVGTELSSAKDAQELAARQAEIAKQTFDKAAANMKELADMMTKSNTASLEIIQTRMNDGLAELQSLMTKAGDKT
ncbi:phasin family protein [Lamprocystis purpurea]|uniref:phasin family protein n=1 Tax=Lamprocystis purpurea TaxID=61598 RepID=UPI0012FBA4F4|nr:phasin family protein [Lamprocystis purpurea]